MNRHPPKADEPGIMSVDKRNWWADCWKKRETKQPRVAVLQTAMNVTRRPTAPNESIAFGFMTLCKFHDREPEAVLAAIEELDADFFGSYPRKPMTEVDDAFKKAAIGEAARAFYRHGLSAFGVRPHKPSRLPPLDIPLAPLAEDGRVGLE